MSRIVAIAMAAVLAGAVVPAATPPDSVAAAPAAITSVVLDGHGNGHGIGLSQWGALGYAVNYGWSAEQILDHYYGGTVASTAGNDLVTVRLGKFDGATQTALVHDNGALVVDGVAGGPWRSVAIRETAPNQYAVFVRADAAVCPAAADNLPVLGWTQVAAGMAVVTTRPATDTSASGNPADLIGACEPATGRVRYYRGAIRTVNDSAGANRTVSEVPVEQYLRSVVAGEMSPSWAPMGGGNGAQALRAQAVAGRTYALIENQYSYAKTCDANCQTYRGAGYRAGVGGAWVAQEYAATDAAVASTAGAVRRWPSGALAYTLYAASSGGYTARYTFGGDAKFVAVPDEGDSIAGNPAHSWSVAVAASTVEAAYPTVGSLTAITVLDREGGGEWGGWVLKVRIEGSAGSVDDSGWSLRNKLGLKSSWFNVRGAGSPGDSGGSCGTRVAPAVTSTTIDGSGSLFTPITPRRLVDSRIGLGTETAPIGVACTVRIDPDVPDDTTAVVINVTAVEPDLNGYLTAYPCGTPLPVASIVPALAGRIVPGSAIVPLGPDGTVCIYSMRRTHLVVDLTGYYRVGDGVGFQSIPTERRYDSRGGARLANETVVRVQVAGVGSVPAGATAVAATIHSTDATMGAFITVWPCDAVRPTTSILNTSAGLAVTNHVEVGLDGYGGVCLYAQHAMHLVVDVNGWFGSAATGSYHALMPSRVVDTRDNIGLSGGFSAGQNRSITLAGAGGVPASGVMAVAAEVTSTGAPSSGYITVHPCQASVPGVSMVRNIGTNVAATTVTGHLDGAGRWCLATSVPMHVVVDVYGYFD